MKALPNSSPSTSFLRAMSAIWCISCMTIADALAQVDPNFVLSFQAPAQVFGEPGEVVEFEAVVQLTAAEQGVQGWSLSVTPDDTSLATVVSATTQGTVAAATTDDPPGLRFTGFERTELTVTPPGGAVSAVVLSFVQPITLDPAGVPYDLLRLTVQTIVPSDRAERVLTLGFVDGLEGTSTPTDNALTVVGQTKRPTVTSRQVLITVNDPGTTPLGNGFAYQGYLTSDGGPWQGTCDLEFSLWRHPQDNDPRFQVGDIQTVEDVMVRDGLFQVQLNERDEFGIDPLGRVQVWLDIKVRAPAGQGSMTPLTPRQPIRPAPQSLFALRTAWGGLQSVPAGFADGIDNTGVSTWSEITGIPPGFADGVDHVGAQDWDELKGIPADFADKVDDDTLAALACQDKYAVPSFNGFDWECRILPETFADGHSLDASDGSPSNAVFVNGSGVVGMGTTSPSSSKTLTLQGAGANSGWIQFRDSTGKDRWHLTYEGGGLNFVESGIKADRLYLGPGGNVGIGTASPSALLSVNGKANNTTGVWSVFSDRRLKKNVKDLDAGSLDRLLQLRGVSFAYRDAAENHEDTAARRGWIAQEVEEVFPDWVSENQDGLKMVTPTGFHALAVEALRELRAEKDAEIAELRQTIDELKRMIVEMKMPEVLDTD